MWRSEILLQELESYRGVSDSYNLRSRPIRQSKAKAMKLEKQKVGMKLEWPLESQHAFTRSKLKESQLTEDDCGTWRVSQYLETCWIASVAFVVLNVKEIWNKMHRKVQDYVLEFYKDPYEATTSTPYDLRNENLFACRRMPGPISKKYQRFLHQDVQDDQDDEDDQYRYQYIDISKSGDNRALLHAFAALSGFKIVNLPVDSARIGNLRTGSFLTTPEVIALERGGLLSIDCVWDMRSRVPGPVFFSKELHAMCLAAKGTSNIKLLGGFVDIDFYHVMGFVRCRDFTNLTWSYQDDFYVNQSFLFSRGGRTSTLDTISEKEFEYDKERLRSDHKTHITGVSFIYTVNNFNASDLETIMESLKEIFFQTFKSYDEEDDEEDDEDDEEDDEEE